MKRFVEGIYPGSLKSREKSVAVFGWADSDKRMIRGGFLSEDGRSKLSELARDGAAASRVTRRANAVVLLDGLELPANRRWKLAIEQTSGRERINIHGAIDLETGQTRMIEAKTVDAASTIRLLQSIEALYPMLAVIHVFLDNARYHHAKLV